MSLTEPAIARRVRHDFNRCRCDQIGRDLVHCPTCDCPRRPLAEPAIARTVATCLRLHWAARGWRIFLSDHGRWWATTTSRQVLGWRQGLTFIGCPDAVDADEYLELAGKLGDRR
jgi:hypothetical protein